MPRGPAIYDVFIVTTSWLEVKSQISLYLMSTRSTVRPQAHFSNAYPHFRNTVLQEHVFGVPLWGRAQLFPFASPWVVGVEASAPNRELRRNVDTHQYHTG